jgi:hypothetical protein
VLTAALIRSRVGLLSISEKSLPLTCEKEAGIFPNFNLGIEANLNCGNIFPIIREQKRITFFSGCNSANEAYLNWGNVFPIIREQKRATFSPVLEPPIEA